MRVPMRFAASLGCVLCLSAASSLRAQQYNSPSSPQQQGYGQQQPNGNYGPPNRGENYGPRPQGQYGQQQGSGGWDAPPPGFTPVRQQGFRDGVRAAREDARSGRPFAVTRNQYYRHPPTSRDQRDNYRDAFQRGYDRVMRHRGDAPPPPPRGQYYPH